jgi:type I restriction enzyme, S subunit
MSRLDELIAELCPDGVEYVRLAECCDIEDNKRKPVKSSLRIPGDTPYYGANNIQDYVEGYTHYGQYVLIAEDGSASLENYSVQYVDGFFWANNHVHVIKGRKDLDTKFLYYYLTSFNFIPFLTGVTRAKLNKGNMEEIPIPIPPLPVQQEIVRILDNFTELTTELTARRKQYEYYRDLLLTDLNEDTVKWISLKECTLPTSNIKWSLEDESTTYKYIDLTSVDRELHYITETQEINKNNAPSRAQQIVKAGDILFATTRPLLKRYCLIDSEYDGQICSTGFCVLRANTDIVLQKWVLYHIASSSFYYHVEKYQQGASYPAISDANVKDYRIPVPPIEEQERIVAILDRFDALCNDLTSGIPAEIEARQKQYEYYRDKLLSFKEVTA